MFFFRTPLRSQPRPRRAARKTALVLFTAAGFLGCAAALGRRFETWASSQPARLPSAVSLDPVADGDGGALEFAALQSVASAAPAIVFAEADQVLHDGQVAAELLRFVTAYGTGIEAVTDVTPLSPLLESAAEGDDIHFYAFIDTWVGNGTGEDMVYMDNVTGQCTLKRRFQGNGWSLSLDLVLWPTEGAGGAGQAAVDTRPRMSVTLGSGYFGARYTIGGISLQQGMVEEVANEDAAKGGAARHAFVADDPKAAAAEFFSMNGGAAALSTAPKVLKCEGGKDEASLAALLGFLAQDALRLEEKHRGGHDIGEAGKEGEDEQHKPTLDEERRQLRADALQMMVYQSMFEAKAVPDRAPASDGTLVVDYDSHDKDVRSGMPVYIKSGDVITDTRLYGNLWWNLTHPFEPIGEVVSVNASNGTLQIRLDHVCAPTEATNYLPRFVIPVGPDLIREAQAMIEASMSYLTRDASSKADEVSEKLREPLFLQPRGGWTRWRSATNPAGPHDTGTSGSGSDGAGGEGSASAELVPVPMLGELSLEASTAGASSASAAASGEEKVRACAVVQHRQGPLFARSFDVGGLDDGERVLLQLAVTGHGWAATSLGCGEYCHAVYQLSLNGEIVANVTQWRDDCHENPINGSLQRGTWFESRNGWCPGTVEPGLFLDVTQWAKDGVNEFGFGVLVWNDVTGKYAPYTDFAGFAQGDQAFLIVGASALVYSRPAAEAIRRQERALTAAELALREGSSRPEALRPPERPAARRLEESLLQTVWRLDLDAPAPAAEGGGEAAREGRSLGAGGSASDASFGVAAAEPRYDVESRAPWYLYNKTEEGPLGVAAGAVRIPVFSEVLIQSNTRVVRATIPRSSLLLASEGGGGWGAASLWFRLSSPPGDLKYDHWDRVGSVGLLLPNTSTAPAEVHVLPPPWTEILGSEPRGSWQMSMA